MTAETPDEELARLIEEQSRDLKTGHRVKNDGTINFDDSANFKDSKFMYQKHGTNSRYLRGCHCKKCKAAHAKYKKEQRQKRTGLKPGDPRHGTLNGYRNWNCKCKRCRKANAEHLREYNARKKAADVSKNNSN